MALIIKKTLDTGVVLEKAYLKITEIAEIKKIETVYHAFMLCEIYANEAARLESKSPVERFRISFQVEIESNLFPQGYEYLKSLDMFKGAEDC